MRRSLSCWISRPPPALTKEMTNEEEILKVYRRVRDEIEASIKKLPEIIGDKNL